MLDILFASSGIEAEICMEAEKLIEHRGFNRERNLPELVEQVWREYR